MRKTICVLPGDGIGPEVVNETIKLLDACKLPLDYVYGDIGFDAYQRLGDGLPPETIEKVKNTDATLFGAVTTPPNIPNYSSPILRLRKIFDLYANIRPISSFPYSESQKNINFIVVRENTEGLYSQRERVTDNGDTAITERVITKKGSQRIIRFGFELAKKKGYREVTLVHKANVLRETCGLFRQVGLEIAKEYPSLSMNEQLVDACAMQLIKNPQQFSVIITTNLFGDILSDAASMLVGGLGLAYSGNIGEHAAVFEPVHGSAPKYVGTHTSNPMATFLCASMMLDYLGYTKKAEMVNQAILLSIEQGKTTKDLNGTLTTQEVTMHVIKQLEGLV